MNQARHHHYLSQCYLRGFTKNRGVKSKLTAFDLKNKKIFESNTRNVGGVRDFNRIDAEDVDPNVLESTLAEFEGSVATELNNLSQGKPFSGETKDILLTFISLLAVRTPAMREHLQSQITPIVEMVAKMTVLNQERYEDTIRDYEEKSAKSLPVVPFEKMKNFVEGGQFSISVKREFLIAAEMEMSKAIDTALRSRSWRLFRSTDESCTFITSDHPVSLMWTDGRPGSPGFLVEDTCVLFPISKDIVLYGDFGDISGQYHATKKLAAHFNTCVIYNAVERVFSSDRTFNYIDGNGVIKQGKKLM